jgi:hypothetical protein
MNQHLFCKCLEKFFKCIWRAPYALNIIPKKEEGFYGYELGTRWTIIVFLRLLLVLPPHGLGLRFMMRHPL